MEKNCRYDALFLTCSLGHMAIGNSEFLFEFHHELQGKRCIFYSPSCRSAELAKIELAYKMIHYY
jgi:hypothetical protein